MKIGGLGKRHERTGSVPLGELINMDRPREGVYAMFLALLLRWLLFQAERVTKAWAMSKGRDHRHVNHIKVGKVLLRKSEGDLR